MLWKINVILCIMKTLNFGINLLIIYDICRGLNRIFVYQKVDCRYYVIRIIRNRVKDSLEKFNFVHLFAFICSLPKARY